jgi:hypothetical protein
MSSPTPPEGQAGSRSRVGVARWYSSIRRGRRRVGCTAPVLGGQAADAAGDAHDGDDGVSICSCGAAAAGRAVDATAGKGGGLARHRLLLQASAHRHGPLASCLHRRCVTERQKFRQQCPGPAVGRAGSRRHPVATRARDTALAKSVPTTPSFQSLGGRNPRSHSIVISVTLRRAGAERYTEWAAEEGPSAIGHAISLVA